MKQHAIAAPTNSPHRMFGGKCEGHKIVNDTFDANAMGTAGECSDCVMSDCYTCQVLEGIEDTKHAHCVQDFIRFEGIRAPKAWQQHLSVFRG